MLLVIDPTKQPGEMARHDQSSAKTWAHNVSVTCEVITATAAFEALRDEWNGLVAGMERREIFHYWEWNWYYFQHYRAADQPFVAVVRNSSGLIVGIGPFCIRRLRRLGCPVRVLETLLVNLGDYRNVIVHRDVHRGEVVNAVLEALHAAGASWDVLDVSQLSSADSTTFHLWLGAQARGDWTVRTQMLTAVAIRRLGSGRAVELLSHLRRLRNRRKNLQKAGYTFNIGRADRTDLWPAFCELHRAAWPSSPFHEQRGRDFFDDLRASGTLSGKVEFSFAEFEGKLAAAHFGFVDAGKVYYYLPAMDAAFRPQRVGGALLCSMIDHYNRTHDIFDFLRGTEDYKLWYTDELEVNVRLVVHRSASLAALLYNVPDIARQSAAATGLPKAARLFGAAIRRKAWPRRQQRSE
jgi:CelD/BcsL family acetyltransferase involved in cellulose biosynthesis